MNMRKPHERASVARVRELLEYNPGTGVFRWKKRGRRGCWHKPGDIAGTISGGRDFKYRRICIDGKLYSASRLAFVLKEGRWPKRLVDHKDGDSTNDRWRNLREATYAQNGRNRSHRSKHNKSGLRGVYLEKSGKWRVSLYVSVGLFKTKAEAARAHERATRLIHGKFARTADAPQRGM